jgi:hypothetical protein
MQKKGSGNQVPKLDTGLKNRQEPPRVCRTDQVKISERIRENTVVAIMQ